MSNRKRFLHLKYCREQNFDGVHVWGLTFPSFLAQLFIIQKKQSE